MSGLLVKSTVVMKEDLLALNDRGLSPPVILGGAALNRRYVEDDLRKLYHGTLYYGEDAFAGLKIMDELAARKRLQSVGSPALRAVAGRTRPARTAVAVSEVAVDCCPTHTAVRTAVAASRRSELPPAPDRPQAPFWGSKVVNDIRAEDVFRFLNERTLFSTQWQFRKGNAEPAEYERQMRDEAYPALERLKRQCLAENILRPAVVYGFFPCASEGDDLVIYQEDGQTERLRFTFPRQDSGERLCLSDYFANGGGEAADVVSFMAVTMGQEVSRRAKDLYDADQYVDYLYLHGLGVESAEALAEYWHQKLREEWGISGDDAADVRKLFKKHYRGCRYSFGYPACPALEDQAKLFELLNPERIGLALSEQFQLEPEQSTTAVIVHHPAAKYFNVGVPQAR
jgi:5-methyltetrahydrofolate--homocysteine methyltransferase